MEKKKKMVNPLSKRVPKELVGEWRKYIVLFLLLSITIGFVSGMYVANRSMLKAEEDGVDTYKLEYGHFELNAEADEELLEKLSTGDKADIRAWALEEAKKTAEEKILEKADETAVGQAEALIEQGMTGLSVEELVEQIKNSDEFKTRLEEARETAYKEIEEEINDKFDQEEAKKTAEDKKAEEDFFPVPIKILQLYYKNADQDIDRDGSKDATVRVYRVPVEVDRACIMEGRIPSAEDEIAIDRMHADNNKIKVGDNILVQGKQFTVVGLIAMVNYSTLFEKNTDSMFDALTFNVGIVSPEGFAAIPASTNYNYAWFYDDDKLGDQAIDPSASDEEKKLQEKKLSDNLMTALYTRCLVAENELKDFVPRYNNRAVNFAKDDITGDESMAGILLYILIVMIAFIFGVSISGTITKEASTIGTLRASGYTKGELVRHYMSVPVLITLIAATVGNVLGYTAFKFIVVAMYYNSYSLPTYVTVWSPEAFIRTTLIPVALMILVTWVIIRRSMRFSPLKFLRHDLRTSRRKKAIKLPHISFFRRFRIRVVLQNIYNYLVLFLGLAFVMILLAFTFGLPATLDAYSDKVVDEMFCDYQYILKATEDKNGDPVTTETAGAEQFSVTELLTTDGARAGEAITVYGVVKDSIYLKVPDDLAEGEVYISSAYRDKFRLSEGDSITMKQRFGSETYSFRVAGVLDYEGGLITVMGQDAFRRTFGLREDSFSGYLSDTEIKDIDAENIATTITVEDVTKISRQLKHSVGSYMSIFQVVCFFLALILIYMLTKVIIEKNENPISMVKILGYENREIASLYLISTTWFVLISSILLAFFGVKALTVIWVLYLNSMDGWLPVHFGATDYLWIIGITFGAYLVVMLFDFRRIKRIPMDEALKNVE